MKGQDLTRQAGLVTFVHGACKSEIVARERHAYELPMASEPGIADCGFAIAGHRIRIKLLPGIAKFAVGAA
jgi:hypothetical protein